MIKPAVPHLLLLFTMLTTPAANASDTSVKLITGLDLSSGDYGEDEVTDIVFVPLTLKFSELPWSMKVTLPYLRITGPGTLVGGIDGAEVSGSTSDIQSTDSGIGDLVVSASWAMDTLWNTAPFVDLTAKIKLPTADADAGLGTGETDLQFQLDLAYVFDGTTPFATLGYKIPGDTADTDYNNQLLASIGVDQKFVDGFSGGVIYDYRQASTTTSDERKELLAYLNWKLSSQYSVNTYLVGGFTDSSPDTAGGIQFTLTLK